MLESLYNVVFSNSIQQLFFQQWKCDLSFLFIIDLFLWLIHMSHVIPYPFLWIFSIAISSPFYCCYKIWKRHLILPADSFEYSPYVVCTYSQKLVHSMTSVLPSDCIQHYPARQFSIFLSWFLSLPITRQRKTSFNLTCSLPQFSSASHEKHDLNLSLIHICL